MHATVRKERTLIFAPPPPILLTVLSWLNFTITLSALAAGLLNFGDNVGRISAAMFSFVGESDRSIEN